MPRTTLDLDALVLRELKRRGRQSGRSIGQIASELLIGALNQTTATAPRAPIRWRSASMGVKVDLDDKEALRRVLDEA
ncbi:MAG TPA: antitoxin [Candidatus Limnocylindria bacterium]|nr:antitoxin [Candidatus Limnocylindria bacterium]